MSLRTNPRIGAIKRAIGAYIHPTTSRSTWYVWYPNWYCGVTNDETKRKAAHKFDKKIGAVYFKAWDAGSRANALAIEEHFHLKKMRGRSKSPGGVRPSSRYVYVL